jgi:lantibiotic modifying enzyme
VDLSGLGGAAGQLTPQPVPTLDGVGTDEMCVVRKRVAMGPGRHRPSLMGVEANVFDYTEEVAAGFAAVYRLLLRRRSELASGDGPLRRFVGVPRTRIVRPLYC